MLKFFMFKALCKYYLINPRGGLEVFISPLQGQSKVTGRALRATVLSGPGACSSGSRPRGEAAGHWWPWASGGVCGDRLHS